MLSEYLKSFFRIVHIKNILCSCVTFLKSTYFHDFSWWIHIREDSNSCPQPWDPLPTVLCLLPGLKCLLLSVSLLHRQGARSLTRTWKNAVPCRFVRLISKKMCRNLPASLLSHCWWQTREKPPALAPSPSSSEQVCATTWEETTYKRLRRLNSLGVPSSPKGFDFMGLIPAHLVSTHSLSSHLMTTTVLGLRSQHFWRDDFPIEGRGKKFLFKFIKFCFIQTHTHASSYSYSVTLTTCYRLKCVPTQIHMLTS